MFYLVLIEQFIINDNYYEETTTMNNNDLEKTISDFYQEFLLRKPDKTGLYYFISMIENGDSTINDVKKLLSESS